MRHRWGDVIILVIGALIFTVSWVIVQPGDRAGRGDTDAQIGGPNVKTAISVRSQSDAQRLRERLQQLIWGGTGVPDVRASAGGTPPRGLTSVAGARSVQRLEVALPRGFRSVGALVQSVRRPARGLLIWHNGHDRVPNDVDLIGSFTSAGYDVAVLSMPLYGDNRSRPVLDAAGIRIQPRSHGDLMRVDHPLRFFLDPVAGVVNALAGRYRFMAMGGLSGGGWTTTVYGAVDPRIDGLYPVAGSMPLELRRGRPADLGDEEQRYPPLYSLASYQDLYVLGSVQRRQLAIWNRFDTCCFAGGRERLFVPAVASAAKRLDGSYRAFSDASHRDHTVSSQARAMIRRDMDLGSAGQTGR